MKQYKVLITGGAGFIGSHLVAALATSGYQVVVLDNYSAGVKLHQAVRRQITLVEGDVRDLSIVRKSAQGCQIIIHLAAVVGVEEVIQRPLEMIETETVGTQNIATVAMEQSVNKIIYASSSAVYDKVVDDPSRETDQLNPKSTYAIAKRLNENLMAAVAQEKNISTNALRFFNVYGERQDCRMVIPRFFHQAMKNLPLEVFGGGFETRDFTHIHDVIRAIRELMLQFDTNGIFNIARGIETNILDLANMITALTKSKSPIHLPDFPAARLSFKVDRRIGCNQKLAKYTGFHPQILLSGGLQNYAKHLMSHASVTK